MKNSSASACSSSLLFPLEPESLYASVAVDSAAPGLYTYAIPPGEAIRVGQMVKVPFGHRELVGYVMNVGSDPGAHKGPFKSILELIRPEPLFGPDLTRLVDFISSYYMYPAGLCVKEILPGGLAPKLVRTLGLTSEGLSESLFLTEDEALVLEDLREIHPRRKPYSELADRSKAIKTLLTKALVFTSYDVGHKGLALQYELYLSLAAAPASPRRLGSLEKKLLEQVTDVPTPMSHFRHFFANPLIQARSLSEKGLIVMEKRERKRDDPDRALNLPMVGIERLTEEQKIALSAINTALAAGVYKGFLLFGVTGSGKTEVYLQAAQKTLESGRGVLWLAPEIALTLGLEGRLRQRFPGLSVSVLHSGLTAGQRHDHWLGLCRGESLLVLGARSAVFAPILNPGLVVVDEEHDWAYKQEDGLRYQGRDLAAWRARDNGAVLILGSATPSVESYQAAKNGKLTLLTMKTRPWEARLPEVTLVDQRTEPARGRRVLSESLKTKLGETFSRGEQALLFINRRGMANLAMCLTCGEVIKCPHCSLSLTLHGPELQSEAPEGAQVAGKLAPGSVLVCHSCGYQARPYEKCPKCQAQMVRYLGVGTERLLKMVESEFKVRGLKLDADSVKFKGGYKQILEAFGRKEAAFMVGTQMAAKGHDFSNLTLVGVVEADLGLNQADFRAAERSFQLLSQVSGRAGRGDVPGRVLIQTVNPEHFALTTARDHDFESFFENEIKIRKELGNPPFARLALIRLSGPSEALVIELADRAAKMARDIIKTLKVPDLVLYGPAPSPMTKLRDRYRYQMMLSSPGVTDRHRVLLNWLPYLKKSLAPDMGLVVDVDPYHLL